MKLFGHDTSPYVRRVRALLAELGTPFARDPMSWVAPSEEFSRLNPINKVPALIDEEAGGLALLDSRLIATYLYDRAAARGQALPAPPPGREPLQGALFHPQHRYQDENVLLLIDAAVDSAINVFLLEQDGVGRDASPYLARQADRVARCLTWLDGRYAAGPTLHPGALGFVDIALCCALDWMLFRQRYPVLDHPNLARFLDHHRDRPALEQTHPRHAQSAAPPRAPRR